MQPAVHLGAFVKQAKAAGILNDQLIQLQFETGGEDMPDAYRWVPNHPEEEHLNIVAVWSAEHQDWPSDLRKQLARSFLGSLFRMSTS